MKYKIEDLFEFLLTKLANYSSNIQKYNEKFSNFPTFWVCFDP